MYIYIVGNIVWALSQVSGLPFSIRPWLQRSNGPFLVNYPKIAGVSGELRFLKPPFWSSQTHRLVMAW